MSGQYLVDAYMQRFSVDLDVAMHKVESFQTYLMINRHKSICLPPQIHLTDYDSQDSYNRRPLQYEIEKLLPIDTFNDYEN